MPTGVNFSIHFNMALFIKKLDSLENRINCIKWSSFLKQLSCEFIEFIIDIRCNANGTIYDDGDSIESEDACEHCYCMKGEIVCALEQCMTPGKICPSSGVNFINII